MVSGKALEWCMARVPLVLEVDLSRGLVEAPAGSWWLRSAPPTLHEMEEAIRRGASDARVSGLLLRLDAPDLGWSKAETLNRAVANFRGAGKPTVAFLCRGGPTALLVAAAAERVVLESSSTLDVQALSSETFFLKDALGELGISPEIDQVGEFKSAAEVFLRTGSSAAHRQQIDAILKEIHDLFVARVASGRRLSPDRIETELGRGPFLPEEAIAAGLADSVADHDAVVNVLSESLGAKPRVVGFRRYLSRGRLLRFLTRSRRRRIVVVHVQGVITLGEGRQSLKGVQTTGARGLTELLAGLRESRRVKAIVVRVDSPGGGAVASDRIRRELELLARVKPVVISMGDVAASGGYYIATAADTVVAESSTLTGSIGVVGGKFVVKHLLDRLGIHREVRATGRNVDFYSSFRSFSDEERRRNRQFLTHFYEKKFIPAVASGRKLAVEEADRLGRGRVWTGRQAHERGLVDQLGSLADAIDIACAKVPVGRAHARVAVVAPRRKLRDVLPAIETALRPSAFAVLADALELAKELAREDLLLLTPRLFRIR
jgi:protease-4